jgi:hypothetical protein
MTVDHIINNVKCELNTRLNTYESKVEEYSLLANEYPEYPKYQKAVENYEIKYQEVQDILKNLEECAW